MDTPTGTDAGLQEVIDAFLQGKLTEPQAERLLACDAATLKRVMLATSARIAEQNARIPELESQVAALLQQYAQLSAQVNTLSTQVGKLSEQVAKLTKNSSNSSKPPSSDIVKPPGPKRPDGKPRRHGGQTGHRGVCRVAFGPERVDATRHHHPTVCPLGHPLEPEPTGPPKVQQVAELPANPVIVIEHRVYGHRCPICRATVWGTLPEGVIEGQLFGVRLQALMGYMKGALHASYSALADFCRDVLNLRVSRSHLCTVISRVNDALCKPYEELQHRVPTQPVLHVDESGWKDCGVTYWIWVFCTTALSFFLIAKSRSSKVLRDVLGEAYGGTLVSDFFSAYVKYANRLQQFCLAHLIRDIKFLTTLPEENEHRFGRVLLLQFKRLFHFWHLRQKIPKDRYDRLMLGLKARILRMAGRGDLPPKSATLAKRFGKHAESIFRFLFDPAVPPTNNTGEQGIRGSVIDRRITQGSRSLMGRQWNARIWTVMGTCRKQGRSAWRFIQEALNAHHFGRPVPSLVPQPA
jgi:transposase